MATISLMINHDEKIAELNREATRQKNAGNLDKAITALQEVQRCMRDSSLMYPTESWLRLPLFLQEGNRFDEAMEEFNRILLEADGRIAKEFSHQPEFYHRGATHHVRATTYDKMRLACDREGLPDEAMKYADLRDEHLERHYKFKDEWEEFRTQERARRRAEREKRFPSLAKRNMAVSDDVPAVFRLGRKVDTSAK